MKKIKLISFMLGFVMFLCIGCGSKPEQEIIGYWIRGDGYTISFTDEQYCSFGDGVPQEYKIYDDNHLQVIDADGVREFVFEINGDTLLLGLVEEIEPTIEFTRDEEKQKAIREELSAIADEENRRTAIENEIETIQAQINAIQNDIEWNNAAIENNKENIQHWKNEIELEYEQCKEAIEFGDDKEYQEKQRDDAIRAHEEAIQGCEERIAELQDANNSLEEELEPLIKKRDELEQSL